MPAGPTPAQSRSSTAVSLPPSHSVLPCRKSPCTRPSRSSSGWVAATFASAARSGSGTPVAAHAGEVLGLTGRLRTGSAGAGVSPTGLIRAAARAVV